MNLPTRSLAQNDLARSSLALLSGGGTTKATING